ncbi:MAG TPA: hypothetical protein VG983_04620 [Caulobacterales bacterium]|jgi:plasmid stability protein|nr:hypothetical protein [Caulobacterales bacterium]
MAQSASILIRLLDPRLKTRLKRRAAAHGRSMEAEAREILSTALRADPASDVAAVARKWFAPLGGADLADMRDRTPYRPRAKFPAE